MTSYFIIYDGDGRSLSCGHLRLGKECEGSRRFKLHSESFQVTVRSRSIWEIVSDISFSQPVCTDGENKNIIYFSREIHTRSGIDR